MIERSLLRARLVKGNGGKPLKTLGFPGRECAEYVEVEEGVPVVIRLTIDRSFDWKCGSYLKVQCYPNAYEPLPAADIKHPDQRRDHNVDIEVFQLWNKAEKKWNNATFEFKELEVLLSPIMIMIVNNSRISGRKRSPRTPRQNTEEIW